MKKICIFGTDKRSIYLRKLFLVEVDKLVSYKEATDIIAPIPFSRDSITVTGEIIKIDELIEVLKKNKSKLYAGAIKTEIKRKLDLNGINYVDIMQEEELVIKNTIPTAEGAIYTAMGMTDCTLASVKILILGFGRVGKTLAKMLSSINSNIYCEARKETDIAFIECMGYNKVKLAELNERLGEFDIVFNTIPTVILDVDRLKLLKEDAIVIDLASAPGGIDYNAAKELNVNVNWALALPAKVAPKTAAIYVKETLDKLME